MGGPSSALLPQLDANMGKLSWTLGLSRFVLDVGFVAICPGRCGCYDLSWAMGLLRFVLDTGSVMICPALWVCYDLFWAPGP